MVVYIPLLYSPCAMLGLSWGYLMVGAAVVAGPLY